MTSPSTSSRYASVAPDQDVWLQGTPGHVMPESGSEEPCTLPPTHPGAQVDPTRVDPVEPASLLKIYRTAVRTVGPAPQPGDFLRAIAEAVLDEVREGGGWAPWVALELLMDDSAYASRTWH